MMKKKSNKSRYAEFVLMMILYLLLMFGLSANRTQTSAAPQMTQKVSAEYLLMP